jgi:redox-sensing transcriptional repressor
VTSILNFAPVVLAVPDGVDVRKVDLSVELQILAFHAQRRSLREDEPRPVVARRRRPGASSDPASAATASDPAAAAPALAGGAVPR